MTNADFFCPGPDKPKEQNILAFLNINNNGYKYTSFVSKLSIYFRKISTFLSHFDSNDMVHNPIIGNVHILKTSTIFLQIVTYLGFFKLKN